MEKLGQRVSRSRLNQKRKSRSKALHKAKTEVILKDESDESNEAVAKVPDATRVQNRRIEAGKIFG